MRIADAIIAQGTARDQEDMLVVDSIKGLVGVADGVSAPYSPGTGGVKRYQEGATGGQLVVATLARKILFSRPGERLEQLLLEANAALQGLEDWVNDAASIPGASLAFVEMREHNVHIATAGDALVVWQTKKGVMGATPNRTFEFEQLNQQNFERCLAASGGDIGKAWDAHLPFAREHTRRHRNVDFAEFNGQIAFHHLCVRVDLDPAKMQTLILCTNGLVKREWTEHPEVLATNVILSFQEGGLRQVLAAAHGYAAANGGNHPEATAIALEF
ncbi:MAG: hypothetical protein Q8O97_01385 [bacterium]|nr:hypothetical protein [Candidatus Wildermuthbacteria bacterium]MDP2664606.1 hypothetical protein [bacterium]